MRCHVSFDPIAVCPLACAVTSASVDEKQQWANIRAGKREKTGDGPRGVEVGDRNFGSNHTPLSQLTEEGSNFVVRLKDEAQFKVIEEIPVSPGEEASGITRHAWVHLGISEKSSGHRPVRLVWLQREDNLILLAANLAVEDAPALMVAGMYRQRWEIELFFWWLKKILKVGHWIARGRKA